MNTSLHPPSVLRNALTLWFPLLGTVGLWIAHLVSLAALTRFTCTHPDQLWELHAITVITAAGVIAAAVFAAWPLRHPAAAGSETQQRRERFLARLGIAVALTNLLLILTEEAMVVSFGALRCG